MTPTEYAEAMSEFAAWCRERDADVERLWDETDYAILTRHQKAIQWQLEQQLARLDRIKVEG